MVKYTLCKTADIPSYLFPYRPTTVNKIIIQKMSKSKKVAQLDDFRSHLSL